MREMKNSCRTWSKNLKERDKLEDLDANFMDIKEIGCSDILIFCLRLWLTLL
jgi:hypothetical protein